MRRRVHHGDDRGVIAAQVAAEGQDTLGHSLAERHGRRTSGGRQPEVRKPRRSDNRDVAEGCEGGQRGRSRRRASPSCRPQRHEHQGGRRGSRTDFQRRRHEGTTEAASVATAEKFELFLKLGKQLGKQLEVQKQLQPQVPLPAASAIRFASSLSLQGWVSGRPDASVRGEQGGSSCGRDLLRCLHVVEEQEWDAAKLMTPFGGQARFYSPAILAICTTRSEKSMAALVHSKISTKSQVLYDSRSRTFSVRSPRPAAPSPERTQTSAALRPRARNAQFQPASSSFRHQPPLGFRSGVLDAVEPQTPLFWSGRIRPRPRCCPGFRPVGLGTARTSLPQPRPRPKRPFGPERRQRLS